MKIQAKLKSQTGASITYALLLFLVCAVVSSVVLAAGTAASGRMSQSVESDQRYYAVTSAAEYLKSMIDGKSVVVEKITATDTSAPADQAVIKQKMGGETYTDALITDFVTEAAACYKGFKTLSGSSRKIELKVGSEDTLTVNVTENLDSSTGRIELGVMNADAEVAADGSYTGGYKIELIFDAEVKEKTQKKTSGTTKTVTETTTMTWSLTSIG